MTVGLNLEDQSELPLLWLDEQQSKNCEFQKCLITTSLAPKAMLLSLLVIDSLSSPSSKGASGTFGFDEPLELLEPIKLLPDTRPEEVDVFQHISTIKY